MMFHRGEMLRMPTWLNRGILIPANGTIDII